MRETAQLGLPCSGPTVSVAAECSCAVTCDMKQRRPSTDRALRNAAVDQEIGHLSGCGHKCLAPVGQMRSELPTRAVGSMDG